MWQDFLDVDVMRLSLFVALFVAILVLPLLWSHVRWWWRNRR